MVETHVPIPLPSQLCSWVRTSSFMDVVVFSPTLSGRWCARGCAVSVICSKTNEGDTRQDVYSFLYQEFSWCARVSHGYHYWVSSLTFLSPGSVSIEIAHFQQAVSLYQNLVNLICVCTRGTVCVGVRTICWAVCPFHHVASGDGTRLGGGHLYLLGILSRLE